MARVAMSSIPSSSRFDEHPLRGVEQVAGESLGLAVHVTVDQVEVVSEGSDGNGHDRHPTRPCHTAPIT